jgi:hypothetical protein
MDDVTLTKFNLIFFFETRPIESRVLAGFLLLSCLGIFLVPIQRSLRDNGQQYKQSTNTR